MTGLREQPPQASHFATRKRRQRHPAEASFPLLMTIRSSKRSQSSTTMTCVIRESSSFILDTVAEA